MQPSYLTEWDVVVGDDEWGLLAIATPETDVDDVSTVLSSMRLCIAIFAVQLEPE